MEIPPIRIMIIDSHTHLGAMFGKDYHPKDLLASMDAGGVDAALVYGSDLFRLPGVFEGITTEEAIAVSAKHPRLHAIGGVEAATLTPERLDLFRAHLRERKLCGVKVYSGYDTVAPTDPLLSPLLEHCEREEIPVIFHTGITMRGTHGFLSHAHPLSIDGVAQRYPRLRIVMAHFGNPWVTDTAVVMVKNPNVYMDLSGYFAENLPIDDEQLTRFHRDLSEWHYFIGSYERCLFGTDYPVSPQRPYLDAVRTLTMSDAEWERVLWRNASELFKIPVSK